ncbi:MAG: hypothetical protein GY828_01995 [Candidatus Gracilibacteria bacterium]|nr:hypothetical protein [Candidatus Gracilibacteria bacterium]
MQKIEEKQYYTFEETSNILDDKIKTRAKKVAQEIVEKNKKNRLSTKENIYV